MPTGGGATVCGIDAQTLCRYTKSLVGTAILAIFVESKAFS
jgi:hypothetical protein